MADEMPCDLPSDDAMPIKQEISIAAVAVEVPVRLRSPEQCLSDCSQQEEHLSEGFVSRVVHLPPSDGRGSLDLCGGGPRRGGGTRGSRHEGRRASD